MKGQDPMISSKLLMTLFTDSHANIKQLTDGLTDVDSVYQPLFGGNCINWIVGHIVVARCNFLMYLDVPSIWDMNRCRKYIPGAPPILSAEDAVSFESLLTDLDKTQTLLLSVLDKISIEDLQKIIEDKTIGEHLAFYLNHESYHTGQLQVLRKMLGQ